MDRGLEISRSQRLCILTSSTLQLLSSICSLVQRTLRTLAGTTADPAAEQTQAFQMRFLGGRLSSMPLIASWLCFAQPLLFASHRPAHGLASRSRPYSARYALYYSRQSTKSSSVQAGVHAYLVALSLFSIPLRPLQLPAAPDPVAEPASFV